MTENTEAQAVVELIADIMNIQANHLAELKEQALDELEELAR